MGGKGPVLGTAIYMERVLEGPGSSPAPMSGASASELRAHSSPRQEHIVCWLRSPTQAALNADPAANSYF